MAGFSFEERTPKKSSTQKVLTTRVRKAVGNHSIDKENITPKVNP